MHGHKPLSVSTWVTCCHLCAGLPCSGCTLSRLQPVTIASAKEDNASENDGDSLRMVRVHGAVNILQQNLDARWEQVSIANISDVYAHVRGVRVLRGRAEF